jgi:cytochrome c peroxidase
MSRKTRTILNLIILAMMPSLASLAVAEEPRETKPATREEARSLGLESLRSIVDSEGVPLPDNLSKYVKDMTAAAQLGKALFHDQAVGSDAVQACVTCHFNAGADSRSKNQVSPGLLKVDDARDGDIKGFWQAKSMPDKTFQVRGPNEQLQKGDFPFAENINDNYPVSNHDVASSMGVIFTEFVSVERDQVKDNGSQAAEPDGFVVGGENVRRVEPRNTPTMINAVFNFTNFWDGRANPWFNGENPFGRQDTKARVYKHDGESLVALKTNMKNASLASQAVGPPLSHFEMSFGNGSDNARSFPDVGRKLLDQQILQLQTIAGDDSLLAGMEGTKYRDLVEAAFDRSFWDGAMSGTGTEICIQLSPTLYPSSGNQSAVSNGNHEFVEVDLPERCDSLGPGVYSLSEANFSLFYGLAVMIYEATLVADLSEFDKWMMGDETANFHEREKKGLDVFLNKGKCVNCHGGPEMTNASVRNAQGGDNMIEPMIMGDKQPGIYDNGFYNIGVTPTYEDVGRGGNDPFVGTRKRGKGKPQPLSFTRQFAFQTEDIMQMPFPIIGNDIPNLQCQGGERQDLDNPDIYYCDSGILGFVDLDTGNFHPVCADLDGDRLCSDEDELLLKRVAVDGAFKTPSLRNVALTAPYFHNGSAANLRQVVQFYDRGGIFCRNNQRDLDPDIQGLGLTEDEEEWLVAFMVSLTDMRTVRREAPFDHPSYALPIDGGQGEALHLIGEVGAEGTNVFLETFLDLAITDDGLGLVTGPIADRFDHFDANIALDGKCSSGISSGGDTGGDTGGTEPPAEEPPAEEPPAEEESTEEEPSWGKGGKKKNR